MAFAKDSRAPGFPLAPFFTSLLPVGIRVTLDDYRRIGTALAAGGPWTLAQLRFVLAALIVRDPAIEPAFHRRFDEFFATRVLDETDGTEIDVERVLDELRSLVADRNEAPRRDKSAVPESGETGTLPGGKPKHSRSIWRPVWYAAVWMLAAALLLALASSTRQIPVSPQEQPSETKTTPSPKPPPTVTAQRRYRNVPFIERIEELDTPGAASWKILGLLGGLGLLASLGYALWLRRARRPPSDPAPSFDPELDQHFDAGTVGGAPEAWLDRQTLDHLADSVMFFQSEAAGRRLDARTTIGRTANAGGCPSLVFERRRRVRRVIVLEDGFAEARGWNPLAGELARGLQRRGIPVLHGRFWGSPERFVSDDRSAVLLDDLGDERGACLLFVFSDGKSLRGPQARHVLERLASWPRVAWMDLREPRCWDESAALPASAGLPVWPASRAGLVEAMARFTDERGGAKGRPDWRTWCGVAPRPGGVPLAVYIEHALGDALLWAQACAMVPPPLTPALADRIRTACFPDLPPERIERLYRLPGTVVTRQGLCFSQTTRAALRSGFVIRHQDSEQERVLALIHEALRASEPKETNGLTHLAWEWRCERVHLEIDPDAALERLSALAASPLGTAIRQDLGTIAVPGRERAEASETVVIPLRRKPATRRGMQRLMGLAPSCGIGRGEAYPVGPAHRRALAGSVVLAGLLFGWSAWLYSHPPGSLNLTVEGASDVRLVSDPGQGSVPLTDRRGASNFPGPLPPLPGLPSQVTIVDTGWGASRFSGIPANSRQALWFLEGDYVSKEEVELGRSSLRVFVGHRDLDLPCSESWPEKGVTAFYCPKGTQAIVDLPTWRETLGASAPDGRLLSVALDIRTDGKQRPLLDELVDTFLKSRSVNSVYRIDLAGAAIPQDAKSLAGRVNDALALVLEQLGPWIASSQVLAWVVGPAPESALIDLPEPFLVGRIIGLARVDDGWVPALLDLLRQVGSPAVEEEDLLRVLPYGEVEGEGPPVRLVALPAGKPRMLDTEGTVSPGTVFRDRLTDGSDGPEMVVVPAGRFLMGSAESDKAAESDERPQHEVTIPQSFAMGTHEVTFEEYDRFAKATGRDLPDDRGWGRGPQPAIDVSFEDAHAYVEWLSKETGGTYRLPSEAEWEYAARAGTETAYWWGLDVGKNRANCKGCGSRWDNKQTAPVGSFDANPYGLYDTAGNVWEWGQDCYHLTYNGAPADGRAWVEEKTCGSRVLRGGSWRGDRRSQRSAARITLPSNFRTIFVGFRLSRTL